MPVTNAYQKWPPDVAGGHARAIDKDLPQEIDFLRRNDEAMRRIMNTVEMPDRVAENLVRFIRLNEGRLGRKRREDELAKMTDDEVTSIEAIVREAFDGYEEQRIPSAH